MRSSGEFLARKVHIAKQSMLRILGFQKGSSRPEPGFELPSQEKLQRVVLAFPNYPSEKERGKPRKRDTGFSKGCSRLGPDQEQEKMQTLHCRG